VLRRPVEPAAQSGQPAAKSRWLCGAGALEGLGTAAVRKAMVIVIRPPFGCYQGEERAWRGLPISVAIDPKRDIGAAMV